MRAGCGRGEEVGSANWRQAVLPQLWVGWMKGRFVLGPLLLLGLLVLLLLLFPSCFLQLWEFGWTSWASCRCLRDANTP